MPDVPKGMGQREEASMNGDNFCAAPLAESEVELLAMLLRRLVYEEWAANEKVRAYARNPNRGLTAKDARRVDGTAE